MIEQANVFKRGTLAAQLRRTAQGVEFAYEAEYATKGRAIASSLPLTDVPIVTPAGAVPPFFAGLLPEGRRLSALRRSVKTSADDELTLLATIGADTIGDVQVVEANQKPESTPISLPKVAAQVRFSDLLRSTGIADRPTLAGVQDKASASMISVPVARQHERFILKLNPPENPHLVENEAWFLDLARRSGIRVAEHTVMRDADGEPGLLVKRFDRVAGEPSALAVEDACQALNLWPADKYNCSAEDAARALMRLTAAPVIAAREIVQQLVFAWLTGNGDVHAKNLSVLQQPDEEWRMSPAYDLPSTLFYGDTTLALTIGGKDTLTRKRLELFAAALGLRPKVIEKLVSDLLAKTAELDDAVRNSGLPFDRRMLDKVARQLATRHKSLS